MHITEKQKQDLAIDGATIARGLFSPEGMARLREAFDYGVAHPSELHTVVFEGTEHEVFNDYGNFDNRDVHVATVRELGLDRFAASAMNSQHVWFKGEEIFIKKGGRGGRTLWHQDNSYTPMVGAHLLNIWTPFERIPRKNALEFVRGSHRGVQYNGTSFKNASDPTDPLWHETDWPRLPDIEAERAEDPSSWDVFSFDLEIGDALIFHSGILHGGAPVTPDCPDRNTLVYRFLGDETYYRPLPIEGGSKFEYDISGMNDPSQSPGQRYRPKDATPLL